MRKHFPRFVILTKSFFVSISIAFIVGLQACSSTHLKPWHTEKLTEEFSVDKTDQVQSFADYLQFRAV